MLPDSIRLARCFVFDMDGTVFLGDRLLPGSRELMAYLSDEQIPFYFLTNNSSRSAADYAEKLTRLGLDVQLEQVFTSGEATARQLSRRMPGVPLFLLGTSALKEVFRAHGFDVDAEEPQAVVLGFDTTLTYDRLRKFCDFVRAGLPYFATHPDVNCPTETGYMPDAGAVMALVEASTGRQPDLVVGKPNPAIIQALVSKTNLPMEQHVMVGDRLYTDIALGETGMQTVLVFSGETRPEDLATSSIRPDLAVENLYALHQTLLNEGGRMNSDRQLVGKRCVPAVEETDKETHEPD